MFASRVWQATACWLPDSMVAGTRWSTSRVTRDPRLAAAMNAPNLTLRSLGTAADGCGSGFLTGRLLVRGSVGVALGYFQRGGLIVAAGDVAARAGLCQQGGDLVLLGRTGPLAGERQAGGRLFSQQSLAGPHAGRGARGGERIDLDSCLAGQCKLLPDDQLLLDEAIRLARTFGAFFSVEQAR